jgi:hypothetical protein
VRFSDLLQVKYDPNTAIVDGSELTELLPNAPAEIVLGLFSDHGRNSELQEQYGAVEISRLKWTRIELEAQDILKCSIHDGFLEWVNQVAERVDGFEARGWRAIDNRRDVTDHWRERQTWMSPPIFLDAALIGGEGLHLVEGHTRVGAPRGLVSAGVISSRSRHTIWRGA